MKKVTIVLLLTAAVGCSGGVTVIDDPQLFAGFDANALVVTNDTGFSVASYSVVNLPTRVVTRSGLPLSTGSGDGDVVARVHEGRVYLLHRCDNVITVVDPTDSFNVQDQFPFADEAACSPDLVDLAFVSESKVYASYLVADAEESIGLLDLQTGERFGFVDLSGVVDPSDSDGRPEPDQMVIVGDQVFVALEQLDYPSVVRPGKVVVIDTATDTIEAVIPLQGSNPFNEMIYDPGSDRIYLNIVGQWQDEDGKVVLDGGIEVVNPNTLESEGFLMTEEALGGNITDFAIVSASKGYALVSDGEFNTKVVPFSGGAVGAPLVEADSLEGFLAFIELNSRGELYVGDRSVNHPGLWVIDTETDLLLTSSPLDVGLLPVDIVFVE